MGDWTEAKELPKWTFRERTPVLFKGEWFRVTHVLEDGKYFNLEHRDTGQNHTHERVPLWMLLEELPKMARFNVGDVVVYRGRRHVVRERKWSKTLQTIAYRVGVDGEPGATSALEYQLQPG